MGGSVSSRHFRHARQIGVDMITSDSLQKAAYMFSSNAEFRSVFTNYVVQFSWIDNFISENPNIFLFGETDEMSYILPDQYNIKVEDLTAKITFDEDLIRRSSRSESLATENLYTSRLTSIFADEEGMIPLILACAYPSFLKSSEFNDWLIKQKNSTVFEQNLLQRHFKREKPSADEDLFLHSGAAAMIPGDVHFIAKRSQSKQGSARNCKLDFLRLKGYLQSCLMNNITDSVNKMLSTAPLTWLPSIKSLLDNIPASVSISSVRPHPITHETFPLVYVNKAFEEMTQYTCAEVLGKNCRFLQSEATVEMGQVQQMREALQSILPIKLAITNVRKDGSTFFNFLALRPVFNGANEYSYVICIHYEVSAFDFHRFLQEHNSVCAAKLASYSQDGDNDSEHVDSNKTYVSPDLGNFARDFQMIEDLMNLLPSLLY